MAEIRFDGHHRDPRPGLMVVLAVDQARFIVCTVDDATLITAKLASQHWYGCRGRLGDGDTISGDTSLTVFHH